MRKLLTILVLALGICALAALPAAAEAETREAEIVYREIKLILDGREICPWDAAGNEVEPFILDGTTYLPVRAVADALGLEVRWRESDSTVLMSSPMTGSMFRDVLTLPPEVPVPASESAHGHRASERVTLGYRNIRLLYDGEHVELWDAAGNTIEPFILDGTTYLPVRAVAELFGRAVDWDGATDTVTLSTWLLSRTEVKFSDDDTDTSPLVDVYEYDRYGRLTYSSSETGINRTEKHLSYDEAGRLVKSESLIYSTFLWPETISSRLTTSYSYDEASGLCVSSETISEGGKVSYTGKTEYGYDALGRLTAVNNSFTRIDEDRIYGEERICTRSYDEMGRVVSESLNVREKDGNTLPSMGASSLGTFTYSCAYDEDGKPTSVLLDGTDGHFKLYDAAGQLTQISGSCVYNYDESGRIIRVVQSEGGGTESVIEYSYSEGRLPSRMRIVYGGPEEFETIMAFAYDENGQLIRQEQSGYSLGPGSKAVITCEYVKAGA